MVEVRVHFAVVQTRPNFVLTFIFVLILTLRCQYESSNFAKVMKHRIPSKWVKVKRFQGLLHLQILGTEAYIFILFQTK